MNRRLLIPIVLAASLPGVAVAAERAGSIAEAARSCPQHGPGFVEVPGTRTCIRVAGRVRSEYGSSTRSTSSRDGVSGLRTQGTVSVDTRTDTAYGPLRSFVRVRAGQVNGPN